MHGDNIFGAFRVRVLRRSVSGAVTGAGSGWSMVTSGTPEGCVGSGVSTGVSSDAVGWMTLVPFASLPGIKRASFGVLQP